MVCEVFEAAKYGAVILGKSIANNPPCADMCNLANTCRVYDPSGVQTKKEIASSILGVAWRTNQENKFYAKLEAHQELVNKFSSNA